eukprot:295030-Chlamydomonas_euryale.AAC.7
MRHQLTAVHASKRFALTQLDVTRRCARHGCQPATTGCLGGQLAARPPRQPWAAGAVTAAWPTASARLQFLQNVANITQPPFETTAKVSRSSRGPVRREHVE